MNNISSNTNISHGGMYMPDETPSSISALGVIAFILFSISIFANSYLLLRKILNLKQRGISTTRLSAILIYTCNILNSTSLSVFLGMYFSDISLLFHRWNYILSFQFLMAMVSFGALTFISVERYHKIMISGGRKVTTTFINTIKITIIVSCILIIIFRIVSLTREDIDPIVITGFIIDIFALLFDLSFDSYFTITCINVVLHKTSSSKYGTISSREKMRMKLRNIFLSYVILLLSIDIAAVAILIGMLFLLFTVPVELYFMCTLLLPLHTIFYLRFISALKLGLRMSTERVTELSSVDLDKSTMELSFKSLSFA